EQPHGPARGSPPGQLCGAENRRTRRHVRVVAGRRGLDLWFAADPARVKEERRAAEVIDAPPVAAELENLGALDEEGAMLIEEVFERREFHLRRVEPDLAEVWIHRGVQRETRGDAVLPVAAAVVE